MNPTRTTDPRPFLPSWLRWHDWLTALGTWLNSSRWETGYVVLLLGFVLVYQLASPIVLGDTDMWTHLNGGRNFWQNGEVPVTPFWSFNSPERVFVNYYWGFQALVYKVYELSGYQGLVILRALLVFACLAMIWQVIAGFRQSQTAGLSLLVLLALYGVLLDGRAYQLRPHLISYLFIPLFIYVLEHRTRLVVLLPIATVLWVNSHGVEWVVGALIGGAYFTEYLVNHYRRTSGWKHNWLFATAIVICLPMLLINPHGLKVLAAPFAHPSDLNQYVSEMQPLLWQTFSTFATQRGQLGAQSAFTALFVFSIYAVAASVLSRRGRISHLILWAGGLLLLSRGTRFMWEWSLLALPLLAAQAAESRKIGNQFRTISPERVLGLALLVAPIVSLSSRIDTSHAYPFDPEGLPIGNTAFLNRNNLTGNLFINPSLAGYIQWELAPNIRVFASMELPPFDDWDMYRSFSAFRNRDSFNRFISSHPVDFILSRKPEMQIARLAIDSGDFAPVFFDDAGVLFAHRQRQSVLVSEYEIKALNPFNLLDEKNMLGEAKPLDERLAELEHVQNLFPSGNRNLHALTRLLFNAKRYSEAERWANRFIEYQYRDPNSHFLKGVILENTDRCPEAVEHYSRAFDFSTPDFYPAIHQHLGTCLYLMREFPEAYLHFEKGVNIYSREEPSETLYQYAFSAVIAGDVKRARILLKAIDFQTPEGEERLLAGARRLLAEIDADPSL